MLYVVAGYVVKLQVALYLVDNDVYVVLDV